MEVMVVTSQATGHRELQMKPPYSPCILLVEDDEATCEVFTDMIESEASYRVLAFESAEAVLQCLEEIRAADPFLFILDLQLPGLDALELYDQLHSLPEFAHQHAIIITALTVKLAMEAAISERGLTLLRKPFHIETFLDSIEQHYRSSVLNCGQLL
jgi:CheY-like chemotaxis protein